MYSKLFALSKRRDALRFNVNSALLTVPIARRHNEQ